MEPATQNSTTLPPIQFSADPPTNTNPQFHTYQPWSQFLSTIQSWNQQPPPTPYTSYLPYPPSMHFQDPEVHHPSYRQSWNHDPSCNQPWNQASTTTIQSWNQQQLQQDEVRYSPTPRLNPYQYFDQISNVIFNPTHVQAPYLHHTMTKPDLLRSSTSLSNPNIPQPNPSSFSHKPTEPPNITHSQIYPTYMTQPKPQYNQFRSAHENQPIINSSTPNPVHLSTHQPRPNLESQPDPLFFNHNPQPSMNVSTFNPNQLGSKIDEYEEYRNRFDEIKKVLGIPLQQETSSPYLSGSGSESSLQKEKSQQELIPAHASEVFGSYMTVKNTLNDPKPYFKALMVVKVQRNSGKVRRLRKPHKEMYKEMIQDQQRTSLVALVTLKSESSLQGFSSLSLISTVSSTCAKPMHDVDNDVSNAAVIASTTHRDYGNASKQYVDIGKTSEIEDSPVVESLMAVTEKTQDTELSLEISSVKSHKDCKDADNSIVLEEPKGVRSSTESCGLGRKGIVATNGEVQNSYSDPLSVGRNTRNEPTEFRNGSSIFDHGIVMHIGLKQEEMDCAVKDKLGSTASPASPSTLSARRQVHESSLVNQKLNEDKVKLQGYQVSNPLMSVILEAHNEQDEINWFLMDMHKSLNFDFHVKMQALVAEVQTKGAKKLRKDHKAKYKEVNYNVQIEKTQKRRGEAEKLKTDFKEKYKEENTHSIFWVQHHQQQSYSILRAIARESDYLSEPLLSMPTHTVADLGAIPAKPHSHYICPAARLKQHIPCGQGISKGGALSRYNSGDDAGDGGNEKEVTGREGDGINGQGNRMIRFSVDTVGHGPELSEDGPGTEVVGLRVRGRANPTEVNELEECQTGRNLDLQAGK